MGRKAKFQDWLLGEVKVANTQLQNIASGLSDDAHKTLSSLGVRLFNAAAVQKIGADLLPLVLASPDDKLEEVASMIRRNLFHPIVEANTVPVTLLDQSEKKFWIQCMERLEF